MSNGPQYLPRLKVKMIHCLPSQLLYTYIKISCHTWHCNYECFHNLREDDVLRIQPAVVQHDLKRHANHKVDQKNQRVNVCIDYQELLKDPLRQLYKHTGFDVTKMLCITFLYRWMCSWWGWSMSRVFPLAPGWPLYSVWSLRGVHFFCYCSSYNVENPIATKVMVMSIM